MLTPEQIALATRIGESFGKDEASLWLDEHEDEPRSHMPEWQDGRYCGSLKAFRPDGMSDQDEAWFPIRDAVEAIIDKAAHDAWEHRRVLESR